MSSEYDKEEIYMEGKDFLYSPVNKYNFTKLKNFHIEFISSKNDTYKMMNNLSILYEKAKNLECLELVNVKIRNIQEGIENLTNLKELYLSQNKLVLSKEIKNLKNLTTLSLVFKYNKSITKRNRRFNKFN